MNYSRFTLTFCLSAISLVIIFQNNHTTVNVVAVVVGTDAKDIKSPGSITAKVSDFDADGRANFAVCRPNSLNAWYVKYAPGPCTVTSCIYYFFGSSTDILVPGDYETDLKTNMAVWHPAGIFDIGKDPAASPFPTPSPTPWGTAGDRPVSGDFLGNGRADHVVARDCIVLGQPQLCWFLSENGGSNTPSRVWGKPGDIIVPGDFEGDGKTDIAVFRNGDWHWLTSSSNFMSFTSIHWGMPGDMPLLGDFDGDNKDDLTVVRDIGGFWYWFIRYSSTGIAVTRQYGFSSDTPVPTDYDGDGKSDIAVHRGGTMTWYVQRSSDGVDIAETFGLSTDDVPIPAAYVKCPTPDHLCF